jgi:hypothetical protein
MGVYIDMWIVYWSKKTVVPLKGYLESFQMTKKEPSFWLPEILFVYYRHRNKK